MTTTPTSAVPREAVVTVEWTGHRLRYLEAVLKEATRQGRPHLVLVDQQALTAPEWSLVEATLQGHTLQPVADFARASLDSVLPRALERVIVLEADSAMFAFSQILRRRPRLHGSLQLMREPDRAVIGHRPPNVFKRKTKAGLIMALRTAFGSRCDIHVLRSPLFAPSPTTQSLMAQGLCSTIIDPVLTRPEVNVPMDVRQPELPVALVTGQLNSRKSLEPLLENWHHDALRPYRLVLQGRVSDDTDVVGLIEKARRRGANVEFRDGYVTDEELAESMSTASAVLCLHQSDVPSGVAALAAEAGTPVIAFAHTQLGHALVTHGLGLAVDHVDGAELGAAMDACLRLERRSIRSASAKLHENATTEVFSRQLLDGGVPDYDVSAVAPVTDVPFFATARAEGLAFATGSALRQIGYRRAITVDQIFSSLTNFLLSFGLVRVTDPETFGAFASLLLVIGFFTEVTRSSIGEALLLFSNGRRLSLRDAISGTLPLLVMALVVMGVLGSLANVGAVVIVTIALALAVVVQQEVFRYSAIAIRRPDIALRMSLSWFVLQVPVTMYALTLDQPAYGIVVAWGLGGLASLLVGTLAWRQLEGAEPFENFFSQHRPELLRFGFELMVDRGSFYITIAMVGVVVGFIGLGQIHSARLLFTLFSPLLFLLPALLIPIFEGGGGQRSRRILVGAVGVAALVITLTAVVAAANPAGLTALLIKENWEGARPLIPWVSLSFGLGVCRIICWTYLRTVGRVNIVTRLRLMDSVFVTVASIGGAIVFGTIGAVTARAGAMGFGSLAWAQALTGDQDPDADAAPADAALKQVG